MAWLSTSILPASPTWDQSSSNWTEPRCRDTTTVTWVHLVCPALLAGPCFRKEAGLFCQRVYAGRRVLWYSTCRKRHEGLTVGSARSTRHLGRGPSPKEFCLYQPL